MRKIPSLDGFRGVSILLVLGGHLGRGDGIREAWRPYFDLCFDGSLGVRIFFVLSGFLITHLLLEDEVARGRIRLGTFYERRALRILPVYFAFLIVFGILDLTTKLQTHWTQYVSALTFTKNMAPAGWCDGHLWSLAVEQQFYLFWPLVLMTVAGRQRFRFAIALIVLAPCFRVYLYASHNLGWYHYSLLTNMDSLMFGAAAAMLLQVDPERVRRWLQWRRPLIRLGAVALILVVWRLTAAANAGIFTVPFGNMIQNAAVAFLVLSYAFQPEGLGFRFLNHPILRTLGVLSFSLYVWQQLFFARVGELTEGSWVFLRFPGNVVALLAVAVLSYLAIERPFFRARSRLRGSASGTRCEPADSEPGSSVTPPSAASTACD